MTHIDEFHIWTLGLISPPGRSQGRKLPFSYQLIGVPLLGIVLQCSFVFVEMSLQTSNLMTGFSTNFKSSLLLCEGRGKWQLQELWRLEEERWQYSKKNGKTQCGVKEPI